VRSLDLFTPVQPGAEHARGGARVQGMPHRPTHPGNGDSLLQSWRQATASAAACSARLLCEGRRGEGEAQMSRAQGRGRLTTVGALRLHDRVKAMPGIGQGRGRRRRTWPGRNRAPGARPPGPGGRSEGATRRTAGSPRLQGPGSGELLILQLKQPRGGPQGLEAWLPSSTQLTHFAGGDQAQVDP